MIDKIQVGPVTYKVEVIEDLKDKDREGNEVELSGQVEYSKHIIRLAGNLIPEHTPITLLHEAIHAMLWQSGFCDHSENLVFGLTYGLTDLFRDNPALVAAVVDEKVL